MGAFWEHGHTLRMFHDKRLLSTLLIFSPAGVFAKCSRQKPDNSERGIGFPGNPARVECPGSNPGTSTILVSDNE